MSIIYDALRKSQQTRAARITVSVARKSRLNRKHLIVTMMIMTALFILVSLLTIAFKPGNNKHVLSQKSQPVKVTPAPIAMAAAPRLMLEGVFLSETEKLAMINHHSYHEGDSVNGMKVVSIAFDQVELRNQSHSIVLRSALTQLD